MGNCLGCSQEDVDTVAGIQAAIDEYLCFDSFELLRRENRFYSFESFFQLFEISQLEHLNEVLPKHLQSCRNLFTYLKGEHHACLEAQHSNGFARLALIYRVFSRSASRITHSRCAVCSGKQNMPPSAIEQIATEVAKIANPADAKEEGNAGKSGSHHYFSKFLHLTPLITISKNCVTTHSLLDKPSIAGKYRAKPY